MQSTQDSDLRKFWDVTVSVLNDEQSIAGALGFDPKRAYKVVRINRETGEVVSMKIREFTRLAI